MAILVRVTVRFRIVATLACLAIAGLGFWLGWSLGWSIGWAGFWVVLVPQPLEWWVENAVSRRVARGESVEGARWVVEIRELARRQRERFADRTKDNPTLW